MSRIVAFVALLLLAACVGQQQTSRNYVVFFRTDGANLTPEAQKVVAQIIDADRNLKPSRLTVIGHADGLGPNDATLADQRAITVANALVSAGIAPARIDREASILPQQGLTVAAHQVTVQLQP